MFITQAGGNRDYFQWMDPYNAALGSVLSICGNEGSFVVNGFWTTTLEADGSEMVEWDLLV